MRTATGNIEGQFLAPLSQTSGADGGPRPVWRQLQYLNYYRLSLAALFAASGWVPESPVMLGEHDTASYAVVSLVYLAISVVSVFTIRWRLLPFNTQVYIHVLLDIAAITLLMHASGGVRSGLGTLLLIAIAGGSLLMAGRTARLFAAIATLAVLAEQVYTTLEGASSAVSYTHAGLLGASFFATAILAHVLAKRLRESEALAERRGVDLANMAQLTEYIIQRMQTGIIVIDSTQRIRLINESAQRLLEISGGGEGQSIERLAPRLTRQLVSWWEAPTSEPEIFRPSETAPEILPRFARLGTDKAAGTLIFIEDTAAMAQQAQQLKLASLGRLTASIAHEVRNPLGAISHAGQLLAESPRLDPGDARLTEIIQEHSRRVNTIIENIMQLSRRDRAHPEEVCLKPWLEQFLIEFRGSEHVAADQISLEIVPADTVVRIDPSQLHQILWNLCQNALRHSVGRAAPPRLILRGGLAQESYSPTLDVIDNGPGIAPDIAQQIFDPFFTTAPAGTGMGLYIARELCESNQARLHFVPAPGGGSLFRITFADPRRRQVA